MTDLTKYRLRVMPHSRGWIEIDHPERGWSHIADVRGWGFLTGKGDGALGLPEDEALEMQKSFGVALVAAWNARIDAAKVAEFADSMEPLEPEFEAILRDNILQLYEDSQ